MAALQVGLFHVSAAAECFAFAPLAIATVLLTLVAQWRWGAAGTALARRDLEAIAAAWHALGWWRVAAVLVSLPTALRIVRALVTPPLAWDALTYHLPRAVEWVQRGTIVPLPGPDAGTYYTHFPPYSRANLPRVGACGHSQRRVALRRGRVDLRRRGAGRLRTGADLRRAPGGSGRGRLRHRRTPRGREPRLCELRRQRGARHAAGRDDVRRPHDGELGRRRRAGRWGVAGPAARQQEQCVSTGGRARCMGRTRRHHHAATRRLTRAGARRHRRCRRDGAAARPRLPRHGQPAVSARRLDRAMAPRREPAAARDHGRGHGGCARGRASAVRMDGVVTRLRPSRSRTRGPRTARARGGRRGPRRTRRPGHVRAADRGRRRNRGAVFSPSVRSLWVFWAPASPRLLAGAVCLAAALATQSGATWMLWALALVSMALSVPHGIGPAEWRGLAAIWPVAAVVAAGAVIAWHFARRQQWRNRDGRVWRRCTVLVPAAVAPVRTSAWPSTKRRRAARPSTCTGWR